MKTERISGLLSRTPQDVFWIRAYSIVLMIFSPVMTFIYFTQTQQRGNYPPEADSIAIPVFGFFIAWLFVAPVFIYYVYRITRQCSDRISILNWSKRRPATAAFYSFLALGWIAFKTYSAVCMFMDALPYNAFYDIAWVVAALWLRSYAVAKLDAVSAPTSSEQSPEELNHL